MYKACVGSGQCGYSLCGAVGGMIVHHNHVVGKRSFLRQSAPYSIEYSLHPVANGYYHRCLHRKILLSEIWTGIVVRVYQRPDGFEMRSNGLLHLYLHVAVGRIHIVKLLHTAGTQIGLFLGIQILVDVEQPPHPAQIQTQVVESGIAVVGRRVLHIAVQQRGIDEQERTEIEIVAHAALLVVGHRMRTPHAILYRPVVAVHQCRVGIVCHAQHTFSCRHAQCHVDGLCQQHHILGRGPHGNLTYRGAANHAVCRHHRASLGHINGCTGMCGCHYQVYIMYRPAVAQRLYQRSYTTHISTRQKTVYLSSHIFICNVCYVSLFLHRLRTYTSHVHSASLFFANVQ